MRKDLIKIQERKMFNNKSNGNINWATCNDNILLDSVKHEYKGDNTYKHGRGISATKNHKRRKK